MSIKTRLLILTTCTLVFFGVVNGLVIYTQNNSRLAAHVGVDVKSSLQYNTQIVDDYFLRAQKNLENLAKDSQVIEALETKDEQNLVEVGRKFTFIRETLDIFDNVSLQKIDGSQCVLVTGDDQAIEYVGKDFSDRDYCRGILDTRAPYISSSYISVTNNRTAVTFAIPVKNEKDEMIGFVNGSLDLGQLQGYLGGLQEGSRVDILDRNGKLFLSTKKDIPLPDLESTSTESEIPKVRESIANGAQEGYFREGDDFVGYKNIGFATVIFEESAESLFEFATTLNWVIFISTSLSIFFTVLVATLFISSVTRRIGQLSEITEKMVQGDFSMKLSPKVLSEKDEVGVLARNFSQMSGKLEETYKDLERKVQKRTLDLEKSEDNLMKALADSEQLNNLMVGRELKMVELKKELSELRVESDLKVADLEKKLTELKRGKV